MKSELELKDDRGVLLASMAKPGHEGDWVALPRFSDAFRKAHPEARIGDYMTARLDFFPPEDMRARVELRFYDLPTPKNERRRMCSVICLRSETKPTLGD